MQILEYGWAIVWAYLAFGLIFAVPFVLRGAGRLDSVAHSGTWGFRIMIFPGSALLWPLLVYRWMRGQTMPPEELTAHRQRCRTDHCLSTSPERSTHT